jgi:hypothetical protein
MRRPVIVREKCREPSEVNPMPTQPGVEAVLPQRYFNSLCHVVPGVRPVVVRMRVPETHEPRTVYVSQVPLKVMIAEISHEGHGSRAGCKRPSRPYTRAEANLVCPAPMTVMTIPGTRVIGPAGVMVVGPARRGLVMPDRDGLSAPIGIRRQSLPGFRCLRGLGAASQSLSRWRGKGKNQGDGQEADGTAGSVHRVSQHSRQAGRCGAGGVVWEYGRGEVSLSRLPD